MSNTTSLLEDMIAIQRERETKHSLNENIYVLIEEFNDWIDYIDTTNYRILAVSDDVNKLKKHRDMIVMSQYKDILDNYDYKNCTFELQDSEIRFIIKQTSLIK